MVYAKSKIDVGKILSPLYLHVSKKICRSKVPIHLQDTVNRLLDILEKYETISPLKTEQQPKGNFFYQLGNCSC